MVFYNGNIELQGPTLPKATQSPQVSYVHWLPVDYLPSDRNSLKSMLPHLSPSQSQEGSDKHLVCYLRYSFCISNHIHWFQTSFMSTWLYAPWQESLGAWEFCHRASLEFIFFPVIRGFQTWDPIILSQLMVSKHWQENQLDWVSRSQC